MKLMVDTANIKKIDEYLTYLPVDGVTTNPSILKQEGKVDFVEHMKQIHSLIGKDKSLHVQVVATDYEGIIKDASNILDRIDSDIFIKIPVNKPGLAAIKTLKQQNVNITATAIYTKIQALLAMNLDSDYLALYINRMMNLNTDPFDVTENIAKEIITSNSTSKVLGASFKNINQVTKTIEHGASHVTVGSDVLDTFVSNPSINKAVVDFAEDWHSIYGTFNI